MAITSGEPKRIDKSLRQLANEVDALEALWGADLKGACIIGSVATQHIYGLLFRVLWPLCAGRTFVRKQLAFPEDLQRASREHPQFAWVASPALLKRMGDNLDWPALSQVSRVFSSGGALPIEAAGELYDRLQQWPTEILGSSETGGIAWRQGAQPWQPFADVALSQDADGALRIASPYLPEGHIEQTADAARIHADGRFELLGRLDRIVKLEEKRISLPMLEQALMSSNTLAEGFMRLVRYQRIIAESADLSFRLLPEGYALILTVHGDHLPPTRQSAEASLASALALCGWLTGRTLEPRKVLLQGDQPEDLAPYKQAFHACANGNSGRGPSNCRACTYHILASLRLSRVCWRYSWSPCALACRTFSGCRSWVRCRTRSGANRCCWSGARPTCTRNAAGTWWCRC